MKDDHAMLDMRNGTCALCNHQEVIDAPALEYLDDDEATPLAVTHAPDSLDFLNPTSTVARPYGALRMLVCRKCGYLQWFASKPHRIPLGEGFGTTLIKPKADGPADQ